MDLSELAKNINTISESINSLYGCSSVAGIVENISECKDSLTIVSKKINELEAELANLKRIVNFSKDLLINCSKEVSSNLTAMKSNTHKETFKTRLVIASPLSKEIITNVTTRKYNSGLSVPCIEIDLKKWKNSKKKSKEEIESCLCDYSTNLLWLKNLNEFGFILNGKLLLGNVFNVTYLSKEAKKYSNRFCKLARYKNDCSSSCKFMHYDDISFTKGKDKIYNIGYEEMLSKPPHSIFSKDEFILLEKRIVHDILLYEMLSKYFS